MSKVTLTLDIDWIDEDGGLDEMIEAKVIDALIDKLQKDFLAASGNAIADRADSYIKAKTELLINSVLEQPITVTAGWNEKTEYSSIWDMVETRMTKLYEGKLGDSGKCEKDPLLSKINATVDNTVNTLMGKVEKLVMSESQKAARKQVASNALIKALGAVVYTDNSVKLEKP